LDSGIETSLDTILEGRNAGAYLGDLQGSLSFICSRLRKAKVLQIERSESATIRNYSHPIDHKSQVTNFLNSYLMFSNHDRKTTKLPPGGITKNIKNK
jgi:hypothetical protein